jgi:hypothetical protein
MTDDKAKEIDELMMYCHENDIFKGTVLDFIIFLTNKREPWPLYPIHDAVKNTLRGERQVEIGYACPSRGGCLPLRDLIWEIPIKSKEELS